LNTSQASKEVVVRAFPLPRLWRQVIGAESGKARALSAGAVLAQAPKGAAARADPPGIVAPKRYARLCLGIGDGSVHRQ
jgi:hypothetical protein